MAYPHPHPASPPADEEFPFVIDAATSVTQVPTAMPTALSPPLDRAKSSVPARHAPRQVSTRLAYVWRIRGPRPKASFKLVDTMLYTGPILVSADGMATRGQRGKIERYAREGKATPHGQVIDRGGKVRTDTEGILQVRGPVGASRWCCSV